MTTYLMIAVAAAIISRELRAWYQLLNMKKGDESQPPSDYLFYDKVNY